MLMPLDVNERATSDRESAIGEVCASIECRLPDAVVVDKVISYESN